MLNDELDEANGILVIVPEGRLDARDFAQLAQAVAPQITRHFADAELKRFAFHGKALRWPGSSRPNDPMASPTQRSQGGRTNAQPTRPEGTDAPR